MRDRESSAYGLEGASADSSSTYAKIATGLGWFSIGLGVAEVLAPGKVAQLIGLEDSSRSRKVLRSYGVREIAAGAGILLQPQPAGWLWSRVAGGVVGIASLGRAMSSENNNRTRLGIATAAVAGVTALDYLCTQKLQSNADAPSSESSAVEVKHTLLIYRPAGQLYNYWRNFENLPGFMQHLESVRQFDNNRSHWVAKAPLGATVEWDAEVTQDVPNTSIAWRSLADADIENSGEVRFEQAPGGRGTIVRVQLRYAPPGGKLGSIVAKLFGEEPEIQVYDDLRHFKQLMETGEIIKSDASIHAGMHAAQPPAEPAETLATR